MGQETITWPAQVTDEQSGLRVDIGSEQELARLAAFVEKLKSLPTIELISRHSAQTVLEYLLKEKPRNVRPDHPGFQIISRLQANWDQVTGDAPRLYGTTLTGVFRYSHQDDTTTARFDLSRHHIAAVNVSTNKLWGVKTILLPDSAQNAQLERMRAITGEKWDFAFEHDTEVVIRAVRNDMATTYSRYGAISLPVMNADGSFYGTHALLDIWCAPWGIGLDAVPGQSE